MSKAIVTRIRKKYPTPLGKQHAAFLMELARELKMGLLKKTTGTRIKLPKPYSVDVAQDIVCERTDGVVNHYDVLKDGEGAATPVWNLVGPIDPARYVDVGATGPMPPDPLPVPPAPEPEPALTLEDVMGFLAGLRLEQAGQHTTVMDALARLENDNRKPRRITGSAGWVGAIHGEISGVE